MLNNFDTLSIWELAHRWNGVDPESTVGDRPPLSVQDTLRTLTRAQVQEELAIHKANGVQLKNRSNFVSFEDFVPDAETKDELAQLKGQLSKDDYEVASENLLLDSFDAALEVWSAKHSQAAAPLVDCFQNGVFDRSVLQDVYLTRSSLMRFCAFMNWELPEFWFTESERSQFQHHGNLFMDGEENPAEQDTTPLEKRPDRQKIDDWWAQLSVQQQDRLIARRIASTLWDSDSSMTQADILRHDAINQFCHGAYYTDKDTLRNWIKDLDPRPSQSRPGRRKSS